MDSNSELNPDLPQETRDAISAGLLESEALDLDRKADTKERHARHACSNFSMVTLYRDADIFRDEARSKREKAARLRAGGAK